MLRIYDYLLTHRTLLWALFTVMLALFVLAASRLRYKEDIADFLPVDDEYRESMALYEQMNDAARIVIIFEGNNPDSLCHAVDRFELTALDMGLAQDRLITDVDINAFVKRLSYIHSHAPYFLTDSDYIRMDTLFTPSGFRSALARDKQLLSMPGSGLLIQVIAGDPLQIFPLSAGASGQYAAASAAFTSHDGYMMSADETQAYAFYDSPYGSTESGRNAGLVDSLQSVANQVHAEYPEIDVRLLGAPVIAVGNARRIKSDSMLAIGLSIVLISLLLLYYFPRKRDILLIALSVGFGWLCGMAMLWLCVGKVSVIVLGIGSVIIGLAVNYPLHLLVHQRYTVSVRQTLQEVLSPLIIGNITTVGAFLALLPIHATALRDLGIFASSMLLGTVLFCILFLPQWMSAEKTPLREIRFRWFANMSSGKSKRVLSALIVAVTLCLAGVLIIHRDAEHFDSDLSHINYMTPQQRADFAHFEQLALQSANPGHVAYYLASTAKEELLRRETLWNNWWADKNREQIVSDFREAAAQYGFRADAFTPFEKDFLLATDIQMDNLAACFPGRIDTSALNTRITQSLSDNFDYLGWVCAGIVFLFLLFSFRSLKHACIAFAPMLLAWIWILGIMQLTGIQFNIVNIILATFLFGQGDDYTIFVLEGALYERSTGKKMLPQYGQSILLSALIMLVSIGVLLFAKHPAMHSLGIVTLIGMSCVVIMAWMVPPMLLKWTASKK